jgi:subtilisin family serine protease
MVSSVALQAPPDRDEIEAPHRFVHAAEALAREPGDERVTVAVVDTGVSLGHSEFQRKLLSGYDSVELGLGRISASTMLVGDSHGSDFSPSDDVGHGSHVAGVIGAQGWQVPRGVAGRSLLLPVRVLAGAKAEGDNTVTGVGAIGDIDAGLKIACDLGADVINMSFGTPETALDPDGPSPHQSIVEYAARRGCVLVAAAGNSGTRERFFPAASQHVIAVGSAGADAYRSDFSTYGDHVAIAAPGEGIVSVGRRGYRRSTGTSHAAPFVAGAAALLVARARRRGERIDAERVRELLTRTATHSPSPADEVGAGVLDVAAALDALDRDQTTNSTKVEHQEGARHGL